MHLMQAHVNQLGFQVPDLGYLVGLPFFSFDSLLPEYSLIELTHRLNA